MYLINVISTYIFFMNLITKAFSKIFKSTNQQELDRIKSLVSIINGKRSEMSSLKNEDFKSKTLKFIADIKAGRHLDEILPESFALVREAAKRVLNEEHYDVQLAGGIFLHEGKIAEMRTGEGKTLVATLPAYLNALEKKGVHIVTVNDYLAKRDSEWMGNIYNFLGLSVGCITSEKDDRDRKANYAFDVTYATNNELGFDYLRDNMKYDLDEVVQRNHNFCIVDEVDSILIDESRTPLIISGQLEDKSNLYVLCDQFIKKLKKEDYDLDEKNKNAILTDKGIDFIEKISKQKGVLKNDNFYDPGNLDLVHHVNQALRANFLFKKDVDYMLRDGKAQIIDEFTGRVLEGRRFSDGLHQAIEAKENVNIQSENQTLASITYQNYFRLYKKLAGMTGTAMTEAEEFFDIYKLKVVSVPTNKKMIRKDFNDQIFRTEKEKFNAIYNKIIECSKKKQPVLVGTTSIEKSEKISEFLKARRISHNVLNAKHHEKEASIIAEAGKSGAITIATNMAGRGTDIKLGGNVKDTNNVNKSDVKSNGGLCIIGTERHESRRIDNQLRGRSGRQGDPGNSVFYISLKDDLMRVFGGDSIDGMLQKLGLKENESIDHPWINKAIERAQTKVEARNFEIRKTLIKFDDVMNDQRQVIFSQRIKLLNSKDITHMLDGFIDDFQQEIKRIKQNYQNSRDETKFVNEIKNLCGNPYDDMKIKEILSMGDEEIRTLIKSTFVEKREERISKINVDQNLELEKKVFLQIIDFSWRSHLQYLEQLRQVIGLRSYGQKDPLAEFKKEAFALFENLLNKIRIDIVKFLLNLNIVIRSNNDDKEKDDEKKIIETKKVKKIGRNEKCSCGSGKKYKHCCGKV